MKFRPTNKTMIRKVKLQEFNGIKCNEAYSAESLEEKMRKVLAGADTIEDTAEIIYTPREEGVLPQYDIRTDRFEIAQAAMDKVSATILARRQEANKPKQNELKDEMKDVETPVI